MNTSHPRWRQAGNQAGLSKAGEFLKHHQPELLVSKYRLRQAERIELVRVKRSEANQLLGFSSRPFVLCGLPLRRPPAGQLLYARRNGQFVLQVTGHPDYGLPFGQDRLVPIYLATLAVRQQSQTIRFKAAAEMLETFGMQTGGKEYRRLVAAFERIFGATIFFGTDTVRPGAKVVQRSRFNFMQQAQIWYNRDPKQPPLSSGFENVIVLTDDFYREVIDHPIPNDLEAVRALAASPGGLDLYMWLSYRCFKAQGPESIPIFGDFGLAHQIGSVEYSRPRRFRSMLNQWLVTVRAMWPECPARISSDGTSIVVDHAPAVLSQEVAHG
jgi:hypothetical protein